MAILTIDQLSLAFGTHVLLDKVSISLQANERVSLLGRNGAGKTTFFKLIMGKQQADEGNVHQQDGLKVATLEQEVPNQLDGSVFDIVAGGAGQGQVLLSQYHNLLHEIELDSSNMDLLDKLQHVQEDLEAIDGWQLMQKVEQVISRLQLDPDTLIETLSGGLKRRAMLARALVNSPDILLLDEPTNHLDIESILWLEEFLKNYQGCVLFISHDRVFTQNVATRILELDRGKLFSWQGDYENYLRRKKEQLHAENLENQRFDKKLAQEEVWIRQGIKARRTRNEGRVRDLEKMRQQRSDRREEVGQVNMSVDDSLKSGKVVAEVDKLSYSYGEQTLIKDFSTLIMRGDRIGVIGPNGIGKSTLLRLILGELKPDKGIVHTGTKLEVAWFDQLRSQLDLEESVLENIGQGKEFVTINGQSRHVYSYLQDFLFSPERSRVKVKALSGGERNRLLLAKLFTKPANLLVLDEPTNDLDSDTLDLLESLLQEYEGTLIIVSHDRAFLNNVVTSTMVFEETSTDQYELNEYAGGYDEWLVQSKIQKNKVDNKKTTKSKQLKKTLESNVVQNQSTQSSQQIKKLSYKEQRELESLPDEIEQLEKKLELLQEEIADSNFYQQAQDKIKYTLDEIEKTQSILDKKFARWESLDSQ